MQPPDAYLTSRRRRPCSVRTGREQLRQQAGDELVADRLGQVGHVLGVVDQPLEVVRRQLLGAEPLAARAPRRPPCARPGRGRRGAAAACRGGARRRSAARAWGGGWARGGSPASRQVRGVGGSHPPPVSSAVRTKGQTRPAAPRRRGPTSSSESSRSMTPPWPGRMLPMSLMPRSRLISRLGQVAEGGRDGGGEPEQRTGPPAAVEERATTDSTPPSDAGDRPSRRSPPRTSWG